jgi:hypothetical protein
MWVRAANSGSAIPIGVKTDCVFVAKYNFENYERFSARLRLKPNAEWDERVRGENAEWNERVRAENAERDERVRAMNAEDQAEHAEFYALQALQARGFEQNGPSF